MKPEQKALLVEHCIGIGYSTAMVGDGANDCQSLKTAEVGGEGCVNTFGKVLSSFFFLGWSFSFRG